MIDKAKHKLALYALNDLIVRARTMAFEAVRHERLAEFLDAVEELPTLIASDEDLTQDFRSALESMAARFPEANGALQRFDGAIPP